MKRRNSETTLSKSIVDALNSLPDTYALRVNAGGYRGRMKGAPKGTADILGCRGAQFFAVELKATHRDACGCEHCESQRDWAAKLPRKALYVKARTLAEVLHGLGIT